MLDCIYTYKGVYQHFHVKVRARNGVIGVRVRAWSL